MRKALRLSSLLVVLMALLTLTACAPKDYDAAKEKLEKKDYAVAKEVVAVAYYGASDGLVGTNGSEKVTAILFKDKAAAKDAYDKVSKDHTEAKKSGAWIYWGSSQGMKDFA